MLSKNDNLIVTPLPEVSQALETAYQLQEDWLNYGLDFVHLYLKDVEGDWLETWENDEENQDSLIAFLESDDLVALRIKKRLSNKSISELATDLEQCLSVSNQDEQLCAVKNVLAGDKLTINDYRDYYNEYDEGDLLNLAEDLLEKLSEFWDN